MKTPASRPIRIAGAGPAGLAASIVLARAGRTVELCEARSTVGHRFIGDFQVLENTSRPADALDELRAAGIEPTFAHEPAREAVLFDHRLRPTPIESERPYGYFLARGPERGTLDRALLEQARDLGVTVRFATRVRPEEVDIVATGPAMADGLAREMTFETPLADRTWVLFDQELAPGGYAYLFVRRGYATFGTAITRDFPAIDRRFAACLARFQEVERFKPESPRHGYSYMNFTLKPSATVGGRPYAGEAAGFQDYLFGLGIRAALTTGTLAARALLEGVPYDALWRPLLAASQRTSLVNRLLYESGGNLGLIGFLRLARGRDFARFLAFWYAAPWWKRALVPVVARWWRRRGACRHHLPEHWCRAEPTAASRRSDEVRTALPELGEVGRERTTAAPRLHDPAAHLGGGSSTSKAVESGVVASGGEREQGPSSARPGRHG